MLTARVQTTCRAHRPSMAPTYERGAAKQEAGSHLSRQRNHANLQDAQEGGVFARIRAHPGRRDDSSLQRLPPRDTEQDSESSRGLEAAQYLQPGCTAGSREVNRRR